jgi:hypothetical protein
LQAVRRFANYWLTMNIKIKCIYQNVEKQHHVVRGGKIF